MPFFHILFDRKFAFHRRSQSEFEIAIPLPVSQRSKRIESPLLVTINQIHVCKGKNRAEKSFLEAMFDDRLAYQVRGGDKIKIV